MTFDAPKLLVLLSLLATHPQREAAERAAAFVRAAYDQTPTNERTDHE